MNTPLDKYQVEVARTVERLVAGQATSDGAGVKLTRVLTQGLQHRLDPFLMLDAFGSDQPDDYIAGFPDHPHRGFETITYMIAGRMRHRDSAGHEGLLENGGVQWMTAGKGVIHSEIPQQEAGVMEGFQLWLNLPQRDKMSSPWYRDFKADDLPKFVTEQGVAVTVIAGASHGVSGAVTRDSTQPNYLDLHLRAGSNFAQPLPAGHNAFVYVYRGEVGIAGKSVPMQRMAILANDARADGVVIEASVDAKVLLISGQPLKEPIVQYGPFVMNTKDEIYQALSDFRDGRLGESA
ncbi:MAG: pirin family protein [Gammaproteobacteria bacterium]|uniref:pirin family protein n=1 Tax=Rhodoferax sp. TaxID=50421 RepID=UPI0017D57BCE|nr:pirin family protein [Rhodoferax sp.]MBU3898234.1 pirin family protein [Gammaproteobacteria bacterium]MBA3059067.1 pirin family protein [Rhodoferax sp.]MBU3996984.1 pirin family protein [Gammaproteobacteria bacterium]MBU4081419.1 pirin family protein [Gammaproteobacteria bacterium]MBU4114198.1 pirin family protein [Gammaproteobacteria bacterium]